MADFTQCDICLLLSLAVEVGSANGAAFLFLFFYFLFFIVSGERKLMSIHYLAALDGSVEITAGWPSAVADRPVWLSHSSFVSPAGIPCLRTHIIHGVERVSHLYLISMLAEVQTQTFLYTKGPNQVPSSNIVSSVCCHWFDRLSPFLSLTLKTCPYKVPVVCSAPSTAVKELQ